MLQTNFIIKIQRMGKKKWLQDYNEVQILQASLQMIVTHLLWIENNELE